jgi:hypothetical protein
MKTLLRVRSVLPLAIVALMVVATAPPGASAAQRDGWLSVSPGVYVGGQALTFEGNLGRRGVQRIHLEFQMSGDSWTPTGGFSTWTKGDGSFEFRFPAMSMFGIRVRVASARVATPARTLSARSQDLTLTAVTDTPGLDEGQVLAGRPFDIEVDTRPRLSHRPDLPGPAFPGRTLTLQQRARGDSWSTLDTTTTDGLGQGSFEVTVDEPGMVVYRVRQENWTANGNEIGWFPSFPTYVEVLAGQSPRSLTETMAASSTSSTDRRSVQSSSGATTKPMPARLSGSTTASQTYGWAPAKWDFAWEFGESLTSRPYRGADRRGWWRDASNGSGRAAKHNGGLMLDSQRQFEGPGDHGTTSATLRGNPRRYGRWEAKIRLKSPETNARDYRVRVELVPDRPRDYHCGAQNITVAEVAAHGSSVRVGAKARKGARQWTYRRPLGTLLGPSAAFAVEVTKGHISWFVNGRVIATVRSAAAVSAVPMTLRLSLVGDGQREMNRTQAISDWQRGFSLERGRTVTTGHALRRGTHAGGC